MICVPVTKWHALMTYYPLSQYTLLLALKLWHACAITSCGCSNLNVSFITIPTFQLFRNDQKRMC